VKVSDFEYELPPHLIAGYPVEPRSSSRLLHLDASIGVISHFCFSDIVDLVHPEDLMVFNNTRVIPARLFGRKESGGKVEILLERVLNDTNAVARLGPANHPTQTLL